MYHNDATAEFFQTLNDPSRWVVRQGVPIFKQHTRIDPATGKNIAVDLPKLYRIAANAAATEKNGGVPIRMTIGHTDPKKPETHQPPIGGYYRNPRVAPFGPSGEPAVVVDEWLDPRYLSERRNFPYRSAEYYDDAEQITGVALLTRDPYLDVGIVAYERDHRNRTIPGVTIDPDNTHRATHYRADGKPATYFLVLGDDQMWPNGTPGTPNPNPGVPAPAPNPMTSFLGGNPAPAPTPYAAAPAPAPVPVPNPPVAPIPAPGVPVNTMTYPAPAPYGTPPAPAPYGVPATSTPVPYAGMAGYAMGGHLPPPHDHHGSHPHHPSAGMHGAHMGSHMTHPGMQHHAQHHTPSHYEPDPEPGAHQSPLHALHHHLTKAVEHLSRHLSGGHAAHYSPGGPADMPFPAGGMGNVPTGGHSMAMGGAGASGMPYGYSRPTPTPAAPTNPGNPVTLTGLPVGYQLKVDQLQYQLNQSNQALQVLYYERDVADTEWCRAEISRLATMGYNVSEYEIAELKKKHPSERGAYVQHVMAHYSKVPTGEIPVMRGDPTPGPDMNPANRPATREEMERALQMQQQNPSMSFSDAINYAKNPGAGGGMVRPGGFNLLRDPYGDNPAIGSANAWVPGGAAPGTNGFGG